MKSIGLSLVTSTSTRNKMKVYRASESEIDERLELDKRRNSRAFCICFNSLEEAPDGFYDLQDKIRDGIQKVFWLNFDDGVEHLRVNPWESETFFINPDMFGSERIVVELSAEILSDKLIGLIMSYLEKCPSRYCVIAAVYRGMQRGSEYLGRFVMNLNEIAVEESLVDVWSKQIQFMEIAERE